MFDLTSSLRYSLLVKGGGLSNTLFSLLCPNHQAVRNSIYNFAFDPSLPSRVFIASAKWHDYPSSWYANPLNVSFASASSRPATPRMQGVAGAYRLCVGFPAQLSLRPTAAHLPTAEHHRVMMRVSQPGP